VVDGPEGGCELITGRLLSQIKILGGRTLDRGAVVDLPVSEAKFMLAYRSIISDGLAITDINCAFDRVGKWHVSRLKIAYAPLYAFTYGFRIARPLGGG
jgi:hypothetical protein